MKSYKKYFSLILILIPLLAFSHLYKEQNTIIDINSAKLISAYPNISTILDKRIHLPFTSPLKNSSLTKVKYEIILPSTHSDNQSVYGILFPQLLHGGRFYLNENLIASIPASTEKIRYSWYEPYMISLPASLLNQNKINYIQIEQSAYQRNFIIPAIRFGSHEAILTEFKTINFLSKVLSTSTNIICWTAGLFLLGIWFASNREKTYGLAGCVTVLWSALFTLALLETLPMNLWLYWRAALYLITGLLVTLMTILVISFCKIKLPAFLEKFIWFWTISGPLSFLMIGQSLEQWLDIYWTGILISFYLVAIITLIITCFKKPNSVLISLLIHSNFCFILAVHDYMVQAGFLTAYADLIKRYGIPDFLLQPIYLTHLGLPLLLVIVGFVLIKEYAQNVVLINSANKTLKSELEKRTAQLNIANRERNKIALANAATEERQKIFQDIHDGLGSKLLLALITLRGNNPSPSKAEKEILNCLEELKLIVNSDILQIKNLSSHIRDICLKHRFHFETTGIQFKFKISDLRNVHLNSYQIINIIRITQECLSNTLKHSKASTVRLHMRELDSALMLIVQDNGVGFTLENNKNNDQISLGVSGILKRIKDIKGSYKFRPLKKGIRWIFLIPPIK